MKRCPQCHTAFSDETQFCLNDGAILLEENAPFAPDEEETIIRHHPILVDIPSSDAPTEQINYSIPPAANQPTIIVEKQRNTGNYLLFLILGLILGGGLVLATIFLTRSFNRQEETANLRNDENHTEKIISTSNSNKNANSQTNLNLAQNINGANEANKIHETKTGAADDEFNGRVITLNAYVRSAPSRSALETAILPKDDRLKIADRENTNSPWYQVTCEHGTSGWMHGDTIEFTEKR